jgi:protein-S-isoprenylcysteine O-methyltransferase Ste14
MPTTWLLISIAVMIIFHFLAPAMIILRSIWRLIGILPLIFGLVINLLADNDFKKAQTTVKPFEEPTVLITSDAFQFSRNPMYLGFIFIMLGIAILLGSLSPYLVFLVFVILIDRVFINVEEQMLADKFGVEWEAYKNRTRRWL